MNSALMLSLLALAPLPAERADPAPRRIDLFKNGLAYLELEVELTDDAPWVELVLPTDPLHASFTVAADPEVLSVAEVVAESVRVTDETPARSVQELLRANVGRDLVLESRGERYRGRLASWPGSEADGVGPGALILLETAQGLVGLAPASVENVLFEGGGDVSTTIPHERIEHRVRVRLEGGQAGERFSVRYLTRGAAWAPAYRLELGGAAGEARVVATCDVINDALDLNVVPTWLVSGFPNLRFTSVTSPLALLGNLDTFLTQVESDAQQAAARREQVLTQSVLSNYAVFDSNAGVGAASEDGASGFAAEDLFFTSLGPITLPKGARGHYPLFSATVPCEEIFRWEIPDAFNDQGYYAWRNQEPPPDEVWHTLRLSNTTTSPWTTAPATVLRDGRVVGQDVCHYTPAGAKTLVKVTKALDVHAEKTEREVERVRGAERLYGSDYDLITIEGRLFLCNYKGHAVTVEVDKTLSGEVLETSHDPRVDRLGRGLRQVNPVNRMAWRVELPAREELTITYRYQALARR